jgi:4-aminobutyrate aminotransferase-like enzyme
VLADVDLASEGLGLYRILRLEPSRADRLLTRLAERGVRLGRPPLAAPGALLVAPPVTVSTAEIERFGEALRAALVDA